MRWLTLMIFLSLICVGCDSGSGSGPGAGTVTLLNEEGVDFGTGKKQVPGNFQNSDIRASSNPNLGDGGCMKLMPGGEKSTKNRPVDWFHNQTFQGLDEIPDEASDPVTNESLTCAEAGDGFIIESMWGGWTKVWIADGSATSVTLQYAPADPAEIDAP